MRVLLVEDEPYMAEAIRDGLRLEAIATDIAGDGDTALELLSVNTYDVAVLDRDIPGPSGDDIAKGIVASGSGMPILMLTAADRLDDKATGFELGADDYLTKPFSPRELVARVKAVLRRTDASSVSAGSAREVIHAGDVSLDVPRMRVDAAGRAVDLTPTEFQLLAYPLERDGFRVIQARDGEEALRRFADEEVDLVVLDIMLPRLDGLEVCKRLRAESTVPIIMLTARDDELDKVLGLELGADDYITKPFSIREFRSRVRALLRRAATPHVREDGDEVIDAGDVVIDVPRRTVTAHGSQVQLTFVEFELLRLLASAPGRVFSRRQLLERLRGGADYREPRTIDVHVRHLREKIELDAREPELILTVRGVGYRFRER